MVRFHSGCAITLGAFLFLCTSVNPSRAEPHRLLGENGALFWVPSDVAFHGMASIQDGAAALVTWSEQIAVDGSRQIFLQVVDRNGEVRHNPPIQLSDPDFFSSLGASAVDRDGNYYVCWLSIQRPDSEWAAIHLYKYDSNGEEIWGRRANPIAEQLIDYIPQSYSYPKEFVIPDERGGCYFLSRYGFWSFNEEGQREDWRWNAEQMRPDTSLSSAIYDGANGFWCEIYNSHINEYYLNHYNYDGTRLFDSLQIFHPEGLPNESRVYLVSGIGRAGGFDCIYHNIPRMTFGVCSVDPDGRLSAEPLDGVWQARNSFPFSITMQRDNGQLANIYQPEDAGSYLVLYDPADRTFPLGARGRLLYRHGYYQGSNRVCLTELTGGAICTAIQPAGTVDTVVLARVIIDSSVVRNMITRLLPLGVPLSSVATSDSGLWLATKLDYERFAVNYVNYALEAEVDHPVLIGATQCSRNITIHDIWTNPDGGYSVLLSSRSNNLALIKRLDWRGVQMGDPVGRVILDMNGWDENPSMSISHAGDQIIISRKNDVNGDDSLHIDISGHDRDGEELWNAETSRHQLMSNITLSTQYDTESNLLALRYSTGVQYGRAGVDMLDIESGEVIWGRSAVLINSVYGTDYGIYFLSDVILEFIKSRSDQTLNFLSYQGDSLGSTLARLNYGAFHDASANEQGENWLAFAMSGQNNDTIRFLLLDESNQFVDSLDIVAPGVSCDLVASGSKIWAVTNLGYIQCIDGGVLMEDSVHLELAIPEGKTMQRLRSFPASDEGLILTWTETDNQSRYMHMKTTLIAGDGRFHEGWGSSGIEIFADSSRSSADFPFVNSLENGDILAVFRRNSCYFLQHISNSPRQTVKRVSEPTPFNFEIEGIYPNPFNGHTRIEYMLDRPARLQLTLFDLQGRELQGYELSGTAGVNRTGIQMSGYAAGLYFARLETHDVVRTRSMLLLK